MLKYGICLSILFGVLLCPPWIPGQKLPGTGKGAKIISTIS